MNKNVILETQFKSLIDMLYDLSEMNGSLTYILSTGLEYSGSYYNQNNIFSNQIQYLLKHNEGVCGRKLYDFSFQNDTKNLSFKIEILFTNITTNNSNEKENIYIIIQPFDSNGQQPLGDEAIITHTFHQTINAKTTAILSTINQFVLKTN